MDSTPPPTQPGSPPTTQLPLDTMIKLLLRSFLRAHGYLRDPSRSATRRAGLPFLPEGLAGTPTLFRQSTSHTAAWLSQTFPAIRGGVCSGAVCHEMGGTSSVGLCDGTRSPGCRTPSSQHSDPHGFDSRTQPWCDCRIDRWQFRAVRTQPPRRRHGLDFHSLPSGASIRARSGIRPAATPGVLLVACAGVEGAGLRPSGL